MAKEPKRQKREISFTEKDFEINDYLKSKGNASKYIIDLIRKDMDDNSSLVSDNYLDKRLELISNELKEIKMILNEREITVKVSDNKYFENEVLKRLDNLIDDEDE
ncbi:MAG: hypothetical protein ACLRZR_00475 [Turicibacter sp.]